MIKIMSVHLIKVTAIIVLLMTIVTCSKNEKISQNPEETSPSSSFLDSLESGWHKIASLPSFPRHGCLSFTIENKSYIVGGIDTTFFGIDECWTYNPYSNSWNQIESLPSAKATSTSYAFNNSGFIIGGWNLENSTSLSQDVWEYNHESDSWNENDLYPGEPLQLSNSFVIDDIAYVIGGNGENELISAVWAYDDLTGNWSRKKDFPGEPRHSAISFSTDDHGYYGLGTIKKGSLIEVVLTPDMWKYYPVNDSWERIADFPGGGRYKPSSFVISANCYVGLGLDQSFNLHNDFYKFNSDLDSWIQIEDFPSNSRISASSFTLLNSGFVGLGTISIGDGGENASFSDFWVYKE